MPKLNLGNNVNNNASAGEVVIGRKNKEKVIGELRRSQLITTFGSGSIVDLPHYSIVVAGTDYWSKYCRVLHEPNLEKLLKVKCFHEPYFRETFDGEKTPDTPAFRFPVMHFCPGCNRLMPYWGFGSEESVTKCQACGKTIVPSRFIVACINGHLEDFPFKWWVHYGAPCKGKKPNREDALKIEYSDVTGGLDNIVVTCTECGSKRSMAKCLDRDALAGYECPGHRPWLGMKKSYNEENCTARLRGMQRGASNVYFTLNMSALTIPPWSKDIYQLIDRKWTEILEYLEEAMSEDELRGTIRALFRDVLKAKQHTLEEIFACIQKRINNSNVADFTEQNLYEEEYKIFSLGNYVKEDDKQFRIESVKIADKLRPYFSTVVMAKRLREVLALRGFRRITPEKPDEDNDYFKGWYDFDKDYVSLSGKKLDWFPAVELLGEGIFISLNEDAVSRWEQKYNFRYQAMGKRLMQSNIECENFSARYVLLHTLSHLLIRQLAVECGYSGAAIKERIYSTYAGSSVKMAGILLYTSSADSDGSLGGLARNALPEAFENIVADMLQGASWCSSDPVCSEAKAQGYESLNYAACHACVLLPETSCEKRNCLLDRCAVVGTVENRDSGYFGAMLR